MTFDVYSNQVPSSLWEQMHWEPSSRQLDQFFTLQRLLTHFNKKVNLTRLIMGEDYWVGQVFDSLWPLRKELNNPEKLRNCIDVGTGCGFPGLAVAISLPGTQLTLVDATTKKTIALKKITEELGLDKRVRILNERIETTGQCSSTRGKFDLAMARAVAEAPVTAEYLIPLIKPDGEALLFQGRWSGSQEKSLLLALAKLNAEIKHLQVCDLPANRGSRHVIRLGARLPCSNLFPRAIDIPTKKPLDVKE